jgi:hypothetical protein
MSGYREHSFDPNAGGDFGPPLRPFNKFQWVGVGFLIFGVVAMLATLAASFHLIRTDTKDWLPVATMLCAFGSVLINSRRQPGGLRSETRRKRMVILAVGLMVFGAALITILVIKGA